MNASASGRPQSTSGQYAFQCVCGKTLLASPKLTGKALKCPSCRTAVVVPPPPALPPRRSSISAGQGAPRSSATKVEGFSKATMVAVYSLVGVVALGAVLFVAWHMHSDMRETAQAVGTVGSSAPRASSRNHGEPYSGPVTSDVVTSPLSVGGEEPTFQGKTLTEWKTQLNDYDPTTRRNAAFAIAKLDPNDLVARKICVEWLEKEALPLAMEAVISTGTHDGFKRDAAIARTVPFDPWGNPIKSGGCTSTSPSAKENNLPPNPGGYSYVVSSGPDGDRFTDSDNIVLFWHSDSRETFSRYSYLTLFSNEQD